MTAESEVLPQHWDYFTRNSCRHHYSRLQLSSGVYLSRAVLTINCKKSTRPLVTACRTGPQPVQNRRMPSGRCGPLAMGIAMTRPEPRRHLTRRGPYYRACEILDLRRCKAATLDIFSSDFRMLRTALSISRQLRENAAGRGAQ